MRDPKLLCKVEGCNAYFHSVESHLCAGHDVEYRKTKREGRKFYGNIIEAFENPSFFGALIKDQSTWTNWKIILKAIFHTVNHLPEEEMKIFTELTGREEWSTRKFREIFVCAGRRSGKSWISSCLAVYFSLFKNWKGYLQRGESAHIMVIASDRAQAQVVMKFVKAILDLPAFKNEVEKILREDIILKNGITISVKTCSISAVRGFSAPIIILDEVAHWRSADTGANPSAEVLASLRPAQATMETDALLVAISSPYSRQGILFEASKFYGSKDKNTLFVQAASRQLNPTLKQTWVDEQLALDYERNKAELLALWRDDVSNFLGSEVISAAVIPERGNLPPQEGIRYSAFADGASGSKSGGDSFALCIGHESENKKIIIDFLIEKTPPFKPKDVVAEMCGYLKNYKVHQVIGDRWSLGFMSGEFQENGIQYVNSKLSASEIYLNFAPLLIQGQCELPDDKKLIAQLRGLERRTGQTRDSVTHFQGGHDDRVNVSAGLIVNIGLNPSMKPEEILRLISQENIPANKAHSKHDMEEEMREFMGGNISK